jgi:hypothetical protein
MGASGELYRRCNESRDHPKNVLAFAGNSNGTSKAWRPSRIFPESLLEPVNGPAGGEYEVVETPVPSHVQSGSRSTATRSNSSSSSTTSPEDALDRNAEIRPFEV